MTIYSAKKFIDREIEFSKKAQEMISISKELIQIYPDIQVDSLSGCFYLVELKYNYAYTNVEIIGLYFAPYLIYKNFKIKSVIRFKIFEFDCSKEFYSFTDYEAIFKQENFSYEFIRMANIYLSKYLEYSPLKIDFSTANSKLKTLLVLQ